jgi:hypothetical protein
MVYDPDADRPVHLEITAATVNDVVVGRVQPIEPGATYVFDKAYVDHACAVLTMPVAVFSPAPRATCR